MQSIYVKKCQRINLINKKDAVARNNKLLNQSPSDKYCIHSYKLLIRDSSENLKTIEDTATTLGCPSKLDNILLLKSIHTLDT